jgi:predicted ribosome quality control (RQC) complex YloA/Tae2 family protein
MTTDWILIRRAAGELERRLLRGRVTDAGLLDDGRFAVRFGGLKDGPLTLAVDPFGSPPLVTVETAEPALGSEPGWVRAVGTALRTLRVASVRARRGDRVLVLVFAASSRFGVGNEYRLVLELVPRYGNVVLVRDRTVVAAAKQFSPAENEARAVQVGLPYEPPPLPAPSLDDAAFARAVMDMPDPAERVRALGRYLPELPRLLAVSVVAQTDAGSPAAALEERAKRTLAEAERAAEGDAPLHAYRDVAGALVAAHVVPLAQYAPLAHEIAPAVLDLFAEARTATLRSTHGDAIERRRAALLARVAKRARATADELTAGAARLAAVADRERLRESGDALYTHVHEVPPGATSFVPPTNPELTIPLDPDLSTKENAQRYYARYRKAVDALPHLEARRTQLEARRDALDVLAFELERADAPTLAELEADLDALEGRAKPRRRGPAQGKRRAPLRLDRPSGARIYVGRSPRENAEVTFALARPDDLWFHARGIPGSHVVLQAPSGAEPDEADLDAAADLAATHSKARNAPRVDVDYTQRKYVRKQRDAGPGLVWYTNARTRIGRPAGDLHSG